MEKHSSAEILLGVIIDLERNFENHPRFMCKRLSRQISTVACITSYMSYKEYHKVQYYDLYFLAFIQMISV